MTALTTQHIVLVGMMGAGKSSVGRALARRLNRPMLDTDDMVEARDGRSVREIWSTDGEITFRAIESEVLSDALSAHPPSVIAAAGGVVLSESNRALLCTDTAHVVWLIADIEVLLARIRSGTHRPLLDADPEATLRKMVDERCELYREVADAIVSVDQRSIQDVVGAVLRCAG